MGRPRGQYKEIRVLKKRSSDYMVLLPESLIEDQLGLKEGDKLILSHNNEKGFIVLGKINYKKPLPKEVEDTHKQTVKYLKKETEKDL
ncbi:hypothetical protein HYS31_03980 [Candidatus Woesearchaeota archaeon]|nr:hypothetical protein [Candidatus Woesearchaeota archaeon]